MGNFEKKYNLDDFIGQRYGRDNKYEIVEAHRGRCKNKSEITFVVKCNECSKDPELFGDGLFETTKANLDNGFLCCGCGKNTRWTRDQQIVRINRVCEEVGYEFLGFVTDYEGSHTKIKLRCAKDGEEWASTRTSDFTSNKGGCPACRHRGSSERKKIPDAVAIESFFATGKFLDGTVFTNTGKYSDKGNNFIWEVYCPKCSNDEYVEAGVCSGVFTSYRNDLSRGKVPCRCSKRYAWSEPEMKFRIKKIIKDEGLPYQFVDWVGDYNGAYSKMILSCNIHEEWDVGVNDFITRHSSFCPSCCKYGFDPQEPSSLYVIKVTGVSSSFTGYGITNDYKTRKQRHNANLRKEGLSIEDEIVFDFPDGSGVRSLETTITKAFPVVPQNVEGFIKEATHYHLYNDVVNHVQSILQSQPTLH